MVAPYASCELWIDGTRMADTGVDANAGELTALDGLSIEWGRSTVYDQPEIATCKFRLRDDAPQAGSVLDRVHVGSAIEVYAEAPLPTDDADDDTGTETVVDGAFATGIPTQSTGLRVRQSWAWDSGDPIGTRYDTDTDTGSTVVVNPAETTATVEVPPKAYDLADVAAWDDIPRTATGDEWTLAVDVKAPEGWRVALRPKCYTVPKPYGSGTVPSWTRVDQADGTGTWQHCEATFPIDDDHAGFWLAVEVYASSYGATVETWADLTDTWDGLGWTWVQHGGGLEVDNVSIVAPSGTSGVRRVLAYAGRVTDVAIASAPSRLAGQSLATLASCTAVDVAGDLANRIVGSEPWDASSMTDRVVMIAYAAGRQDPDNAQWWMAITDNIDAPLGDYQVSYRDVDAQPVWQLYADLADTVGGVLWVAYDRNSNGPYLWFENPDNRAALLTFVSDGTTVTIAGDTGTARGKVFISACEVPADDVTWRQDVSDIVTAVAVGWKDQTLNDDGDPAPTDKTATVKDAAAEATYGRRRMSLSTELTTAADAKDLGRRHLARSRELGWRMDGLTYDTAILPDQVESVDDVTRANTLADMLDGTVRLGLGLALIDLPDYMPAGGAAAAFIDGGTYTFEAGHWSLELSITPAGTAGASATWADFTPTTWTWAMFDPAIAWYDAYGVAGPTVTALREDA